MWYKNLIFPDSEIFAENTTTSVEHYSSTAFKNKFRGSPAVSVEIEMTELKKILNVSTRTLLHTAITTEPENAKGSHITNLIFQQAPFWNRTEPDSNLQWAVA